jgi:hypothetical protein
MRPFFIIAAAVNVAALLTLSGPARAQANRTFVSGHGSDTSPCSLAAPCRTLQGAFNQTLANGEITVLDAAGYGALTIAHAIGVNSDGVGEAGVTGITITAGAGDVVNLRGLSLVGDKTGATGIAITSAGTVNVQNCLIKDFTARGIATFTTSDVVINVSDTTFSGNGSAGIVVAPSGAGSAVVSLNHDQFFGNGLQGAELSTSLTTGAVKGMVANSYFTGNGIGVFALSATGTGLLNVALTNSQLFSNGVGLNAQGPVTTVALAQTTIAGDQAPGAGYFIGPGAVVNSHGNNSISSSNNTGALTPVGQQ